MICNATTTTLDQFLKANMEPHKMGKVIFFLLELQCLGFHFGVQLVGKCRIQDVHCYPMVPQYPYLSCSHCQTGLKIRYTQIWWSNNANQCISHWNKWKWCRVYPTFSVTPKTIIWFLFSPTNIRTKYLWLARNQSPYLWLLPIKSQFEVDAWTLIIEMMCFPLKNPIKWPCFMEFPLNDLYIVPINSPWKVALTPPCSAVLPPFPLPSPLRRRHAWPASPGLCHLRHGV